MVRYGLLLCSLALAACSSGPSAPAADLSVNPLADFAVPPCPTIQSFSPSAGPVGTQVDIFGMTLGGVNAVVKFSGNAVAPVIMGDNLSIAVDVPVGAGTGTISVTSNGCTATSNIVFTVL